MLIPEIMTGFRRGRGSEDSTLDLITSVQQESLGRRFCVAIFLDVKATFDFVPHTCILSELLEIGL